MHPFAVDRAALAAHGVAHLAAAKERGLQVLLINHAHQREVLRVLGLGPVVQPRAADRKPLTLAHDAELALGPVEWLGTIPSFSRPTVRNDNPYSEALFRTVKYTPGLSARTPSPISRLRASGSPASSSGITTQRPPLRDPRATSCWRESPHPRSPRCGLCDGQGRASTALAQSANPQLDPHRHRVAQPRQSHRSVSHNSGVRCMIDRTSFLTNTALERLTKWRVYRHKA